jgi:hypothetical protein
MVATSIRVPLRHGFPNRTSGSIETPGKISIAITLTPTCGTNSFNRDADPQATWAVRRQDPPRARIGAVRQCTFLSLPPESASYTVQGRSRPRTRDCPQPTAYRPQAEKAQREAGSRRPPRLTRPKPGAL